jgi:hypothetical protein
MRLVGSFITVLCLSFPSWADTPALCSAKNASTAPSYVLITAIYTKTGERLVTTVTSTGLQESLAVENGLAKNDFKKIFLLIDEHPDLTFRFHNQVAFEWLRPQYLEWISEARKALAGISDEQIYTGFGNNGELHKLYNTELSQADYSFYKRQQAIAHVLLERGFYPGMGDYVPTLYLSRNPCRKPWSRSRQRTRKLCRVFC